MATNYPTSIDTFVNPTSNDSLNAPSHSQQHTNLNDAMVAVQTKLGYGNANKVGMDLIVSQDVGASAVATVVVSNVFSSFYTNYKIVYSNIGTSATNALALTFNNSASTTYRFRGFYLTNTASAITVETSNSASNITIGITEASSATSGIIEILRPFLTTQTDVFSNSSGLTYGSWRTGTDTNAASQTGFTLTAVGGTMTNGTIRVYGYRNS